MQTLSSSKHRSRALVRLRPLMIALCAAGYASATLAQAVLPSRDINANTLPNVGNTYGDITSSVSTTASGVAKLTINQTSARGVVEVGSSSANGQFQTSSLSVGSNAWVDVVAPNASSLTVLRSLGQDPSYIYGRITANDRLFVINSNGIYVGATGSVSASSLVMSALDLRSDYVENNYAKLFADTHVVFSAGASGYGYGSYGSPVVEIEKGATLTATDGGGVMLIGDRGVRNAGGISVGSGGDITLVAGATVEADIGDSGYIKLASVADASVPDQFQDATGRSVVNAVSGTIDAPNGTVTLQTKGNGQGGNVFGDPTGLSTLVTDFPVAGVMNAGTIRANGSNGGQGTVTLKAEGDRAGAFNSGTIDVSAKDARSTAGSIVMSAANVIVGPNISTNLNPDEPLPATQLLAEGPSGGGTITLNNVGATESQSPNQIQVRRGATLSADATDDGKGGTIKLSTLDGFTVDEINSNLHRGELRVYGTLQARGGLNGGDGGAVETSGTYVSVRDADLGGANILVGARAAGAVGGIWSVYSPSLTIGRGNGSAASETYIADTDINAVLNSGGSVGISTSYPPELSSQTQARKTVVSDTLTVRSGARIVQSEGLGGNRLYLQSGSDLVVQGGATVTSTAGKLDVSLVADAYGVGKGSVILDGASRAADTRQGLEVAPEGGIAIQTNGGNLNLMGAVSPATAGTTPVNDNPGVSINGAVISTVGTDSTGQAVRGDVLVKGSGGVAGDSVSADTTVASQIGVAIGGGTTIDAGNVTILGNSTSVAGVSLANTTISTDKGIIDIRGVSEGGRTVPFREQPIGVDIGAGVTLNAGQGSVRILGRGVRDVGAAVTGVDTYGVRANDLLITTSEANPGQQITIVGQSGGSAGAGIQVDSGQPGIQVYGLGPGGIDPITSSADIVIGASADASATRALNLGTPTFNTIGRLNFRPAGVSADGKLTEATATAIRVGTGAGSIPTNFIVNPAWFNASVNPGVSAGAITVIGSNAHAGQISVEDGALNGAGKVTLQNQNEPSSASASGSAAGNKTAAAVAPAPGGIDLGAQTGANPALNLTLATAGDITQSGPINVAALQVIGAPGSNVQLNNLGNQIGRAIYNNGVLAPQINAQSLPQATTSATAMGYSVNTGDTATNAFVPLAINYTFNRNEQPYIPPDQRPKLPFESVDALNELRTDVYLHGQFSRPQLCTPANTLAAVTTGSGEAEPLSLEWTKVRRGAQLSNCSGVQADGNCAAF